MTKAFFKKLDDGSWAVRVPGSPWQGRAGEEDLGPAIGAQVMVVKRNGEQRPVVITAILEEVGDDFICRFVDAAPDTPAPAAKKQRAFAPTAEQDHALEIFRTGESLVIQAGAGTGKTSTLVLLGEDGEARGLRGQYVAFNNKIVADSAGKFPGSVTCNTAHSLAYRAVGGPFSKRMNSGKRMKSHEIARILRLDPIRVTKFTGESKELSAAFLGGLVMKSVARFCQTADTEISYRHVPAVDGLDAPATEDRPVSYAVNNEVARALVPALRRAWSDLTKTDGALPFTLSTAMAVYLKLWHLSGPRINADYILFDEAQDANPVMVAVIAAQTHAQLVWVGDSNQSIYSFTGAINALESVPAERTAMLTQSFRFGPAVADVANTVLATLPTPMRLTGTTEIASRVAPVLEPRAILTRTNATAIRSVMTAIANGQRPYLVGEERDHAIARFCRSAQDLMETGRTEHPELACFSNWGEVQEYVAQDEQGDDLRLMVNLIDEFGVQMILDAVNGCSKEADADVIVSTAHKAKGCEWDSVKLGGDFPEPAKMNDEEKRLLYVAVTRAKLELDITAVAFFTDEEAPEDGASGGSESPSTGQAAPAQGNPEDVASAAHLESLAASTTDPEAARAYRAAAKAIIA